MWDDLASSLESEGFLCSKSGIASYATCIYSGMCAQVADKLPTLKFTVDGFSSSNYTDSDNFTLEASPLWYLWQNEDSNYCESLVSISSSNTTIIFGAPIFRQHEIMINYTNFNITFYERKVKSPIVPDVYWDPSLYDYF